MSQITTLLTGAGVTTVVSGQTQCEQYILIGDVDNSNPLQGIAVEIDGTSFINIANAQNLITAFMKWQMETTGAVIGLLLKIATGVIKKNTTYRFTNAAATTPAIFAYSEERDGVPLMASTKSINASSYEDFENFSALFLQTPANVGTLEVVFRDGHKATMSIAEADSLFSLYNQSETDGRLGGVTVIDNTKGNIRQVRVNTNNVGACVVLIAKLPDTAFQILKGGN